MDARRLLALITLFAATTAALAVPWLRLPYNQLEDALFTPPMLPGIVLLAAGPLYMVICEIASARRALAIMALCAPVADIVLIARDTAIDPTNHNLWPFELVMMTLWGLIFIVPGVLLGAALRRWARRQARG